MTTDAKLGLDALKTLSKRIVHKAAETTGQVIENKFADQIVKTKPTKCWRNAEEIVIPSEKRQEILNQLRQVL